MRAVACDGVGATPAYFNIVYRVLGRRGNVEALTRLKRLDYVLCVPIFLNKTLISVYRLHYDTRRRGRILR
jgi:hypothetical protein